jgi:iron complex outermembrane receptor protein
LFKISLNKTFAPAFKLSKVDNLVQPIIKRKTMKSIFQLLLFFLPISIFAQNTVADSIRTYNLDEVTVKGFTNKYYRDSSITVAKLPLKDLENPQVYNSISNRLLGEQVVTNMNDALKNATGVAKLWESTGRGGDGAEFYSMRGFALQPTMMNGVPSINNGALDPANVERIEVIKGPSGTLFGSPLISYGGLVNVSTKRPYDVFGGRVGYVAGAFGLNRFTADVNTPLGKGIAMRLNAAYHSENTFQDAGFRKRIYLAPSFSIKAGEQLTFLVNTEFLNSEAANAPMVFLNRYAPLSFSTMDVFVKNYENSFTSNDLTIRNPTIGIQAQALYKISSGWNSQTVLSRSSAKTDGYYQYLWDDSNGDSFTRFISKRNGETLSTDVQQNFIGDFKLASLRNRLVIGVDYFKANILNSSSGWIGDGTVSLVTGEDTGDLTQAGVDELLVGSFEGNSDAESEVMSAYLSDVINLLPSLSAMASVRIDRFDGRTSYWQADKTDGQVAVSPKFGLVWQPVLNKVSVFGNYMNGFVNVAPVQVADMDGSNPRLATFDPEQANQYEFGVKTNLLQDKIALTASYYNIAVKNRVMGDPENVNNTIQGGEVESKGYEFSLVASPVVGLNLVAGYSHNDSEVTKDNPGDGYLGLRPEEAGPADLVNFWASYNIPSGKLAGLGIGFGGNHASEYMTLNRANTGTFTLPSYTVLNAAISYTKSRYSLILKMDNLTDEHYWTGWSTITPQRLRSTSFSLNYLF